MEEKLVNTEETQDQVQEESTEQPFKTFESESDLDRYTDKRVSKALETARAKWNEELEAKLAEREDKAKKLAQMTAKERAEAKLNERQKELDTREHELNMKAYRIEAQKQLEEQKLPGGLVDLVLTDDAEKTHENIKLLADTVDNLIKERVNELSNTQKPKDSADFKPSSLNDGGLAAFAQQNRLIK